MPFGPFARALARKTKENPIFFGQLVSEAAHLRVVSFLTARQTPIREKGGRRLVPRDGRYNEPDAYSISLVVFDFLDTPYASSNQQIITLFEMNEHGESNATRRSNRNPLPSQ